MRRGKGGRLGTVSLPEDAEAMRQSAQQRQQKPPLWITLLLAVARDWRAACMAEIRNETRNARALRCNEPALNLLARRSPRGGGRGAVDWKFSSLFSRSLVLLFFFYSLSCLACLCAVVCSYFKAVRVPNCMKYACVSSM